MKKILMILVIAMLAALPVSAQIPKLMTYQGVLTDDMGVVVSDGSYNMTFRIYDVPSGGSPLWEETFGVNVSKGIFNTILGYTTPIDLVFDESVYLGLAIDGGAELTPRRLFTSNAHSFSALAVFGDDNIFPSNGSVGIGTTGPSYPLHVVTDDIRGIRLDGTAIGAWSLLSINAAGSGSNPGIEYRKTGLVRAMTYVDPSDNWHLRVGTTNVLTAESGTNNIGIDKIDPEEKLDVDGAIRLGTTANTNAGTLRWTGTDFEGYDGSLWHSLTTGGGSGLPPGAAGQTLRHNGADWTATSNLYNDGTNVGIGTTSPSAELHVYGTEIEEVRVESTVLTGTAAVELLTSGGSLDYLRLEKSGPSRSGTTAGGIPIANLSRITAGTLAGALMLQTVPDEPIHFVTDNIERFRITETGSFDQYYNGTMVSQLYGMINGSIFNLYDEEGNYTCSLQPDINTGGGGYMFLRRNNGDTGFRVDGNYGATEGTMVSILGATTSIALNASTTGNGTVVFPTDAISATEILDEPGVVSATSNTSTTILTTFTTISSRTITAPAAGYVLVIATGQSQVGHANGTNTSVDFGVSASSTSLPANQDVNYLIPTGAATGTYCTPVTCHGLFEVTAGANTFYFLGRKYADSYNASCLDKQLTAIFIPTSYGTVTPTLAAGGPDDDSVPQDNGMTSGEIADARARSIEANNTRIERELAEMRDRLEALQAELDNSN